MSNLRQYRSDRPRTLHCPPAECTKVLSSDHSLTHTSSRLIRTAGWKYFKIWRCNLDAGGSASARIELVGAAGGVASSVALPHSGMSKCSKPVRHLKHRFLLRQLHDCCFLHTWAYLLLVLILLLPKKIHIEESQLRTILLRLIALSF